MYIVETLGIYKYHNLSMCYIKLYVTSSLYMHINSQFWLQCQQLPTLSVCGGRICGSDGWRGSSKNKAFNKVNPYYPYGFLYFQDRL